MLSFSQVINISSTFDQNDVASCTAECLVPALSGEFHTSPPGALNHVPWHTKTRGY